MRLFIVVVFATVLMAIPASAGAAPRPAGSCENVEGTFLGQAVPTATGFDVYVVETTGPIAGNPVGTQLVWVTVEKVTPGGTVHFTGVHVFENTAFGDFTTRDSGVITPNGRVHNTLRVVEGGAGQLNVRGQVDLATGVVDVAYSGRLCN